MLYDEKLNRLFNNLLKNVYSNNSIERISDISTGQHS